MKKIYGYDVYFRLKTPASVLVAAHNKEEAKKKALEYLDDIPREELIARIMAAVEFSPNFEITFVDRVDELTEDDLEMKEDA